MTPERIRNFRAITRRLERVISRQLEECYCCSGVTMAQCHMLLEIEESGPAHIQKLADRMHLDKSTVSRTVDGLATLGLVDREPGPDDRRFTLVRLTGQGAAICSSINRINDDYYRRVFDSIPEEQHEDVVRSVASLTRAMNATELQGERDIPTQTAADRPLKGS
jgi:DNA-binding MarR family transcriptional regulator